MQHEVIPSIAKKTFAVAYALGGIALLVAATNQSDLWVGLMCVIGALMLVLAAVLSFAESATTKAPVTPLAANGPSTSPKQTEAASEPLASAQTQHAAQATTPKAPEPELEAGTKAEPKPEPTREPNPEPEALPEPKPGQPATPSPSPETLRLIMLRSKDALATLRELATHDSDSPLATALRATGILELEDDSHFECAHIKRSSRFWFHADLQSASPEKYDVLTSAEAVLNTYQDALLATSASDDVFIRMREVYARMPRAVYDAESKLGLTSNKKGMSGEWGTRLRFAEFCECVALPFRTSYSFDVNLRDGAFDITASVPRPRCFSYLAADASARARAARTYALDLAQALAQGAFDAHERIAHVQVRCHEQGSDRYILSLLIDRSKLGNGRVSKLLSLDIQELISAGYVQAQIGDDGWYLPLEEDSNRLQGLLDRPDRWVPPELRKDELPQELAKLCRARSFADLTINENAMRIEAWGQLAPKLDGTLATAAKHLVALRDASDDLSTVEAANRLANALVNDEMDVNDTKAMQKLFIDGSSLDQTCEMANHAFHNGDHDEKERALARLEAELAPLMLTGLYLDDELSVYRYFNSLPERIAYNLAVDDGARSVRLVPDAYYAAHSLAARLSGILGHLSMAFEHANEICRVAPYTADALFAKVRLLEDNTQVIEAASLLHKLIERAPSHHVMALAFYRLAYMEWKLGRSDLAAACYERSIEISSGVAQQALPELEDLLAAEPTLRRLTPDQTKAALAKANIPYGNDQGLFERLALISQAATDAEVFSVAFQMTSFYADARHDDIAVAVYNSFRPQQGYPR